MAQEENLVRIPAPATICGDIHGQFEDLLELFKVGGEIPDVNYVFLGDYVDRGFKSVETMLYLLALKVKYPERINLIRGNHECRGITQQYGFYDECIRKFGSLNVWRECTNAFDFMIVSAIIDDRIFCVHGGLSPKIKNMKDLNLFDRKKEIPHDGPMCDIMWSDPDESVKTWTYSTRGAGWLFGQEIVEKFCHENKVELVARAHQLVMEGYKQVFNDKLVTVWSAPNYCGKCGNLASILELDENMAKVYKIFEQTPIDEIKPDKKTAGDLYNIVGGAKNTVFLCLAATEAKGSWNNLELIARAHQLVMEGYKHHFNGLLVTVWSAPNYCYKQNVACVLANDELMKRSFTIFEQSPDEAEVVLRANQNPADHHRYRYAV